MRSSQRFISGTGHYFHMPDQASLKLLLRARAELIAAMLLIGERIRQKQALSLIPVLPLESREEFACRPYQSHGCFSRLVVNQFSAIKNTRAIAAQGRCNLRPRGRRRHFEPSSGAN